MIKATCLIKFVGRKAGIRPTFSQLDGNYSLLTSPSPPPSPSATSTATPVEDNSTAPEPTVFVCDRPPGRSRNPWNMCGKTFKSENDLRRHGHREHDYCYEHQVRYDVICPATDVKCRSQALAFNYFYHPD